MTSPHLVPLVSICFFLATNTNIQILSIGANTKQIQFQFNTYLIFQAAGLIFPATFLATYGWAVSLGHTDKIWPYISDTGASCHKDDYDDDIEYDHENTNEIQRQIK